MSTQTEFRGALLDAERAVPEGLTDGTGRPAGRRFAVYRNNVAVSLGEALAEGFPAVQKLIGEDNFAKAAGLYLRDAPPDSPLLMHYGATFADFLATFQPLNSIGYLADVARLEMAIRRSYHAADAAPADAAPLQEMDEDTLLRTRMRIAPAVQVVTSPWPLWSVYNFTMLPDQPKPQARAEDVIILRPEFDPAPHALPQGGAAFVTALANGAPLGDAIEAAGKAFDLGATLSLLLGHGAVTEILPPEDTGKA